MKKNKQTARRQHNNMKDILYENRNRYDVTYENALREAKKLMGIPNLESENWTDRQRSLVKRNLKIANRIAKFLSKYDASQGDIIVAKKRFFDSINKQIDASNDYRKHNGLLLLDIPEITPIDMDKLESIETFYYLVPNLWNQSKVCKHEKRLVLTSPTPREETKVKEMPVKEKLSKKEKNSWRTRKLEDIEL